MCCSDQLNPPSKGDFGRQSNKVCFTPKNGHLQGVPACPVRADIVAKVFLRWRTKIPRAADAFCARRREGTMSFHPKSITDLRSSVGKRRSGQRSPMTTLASFFGPLDFRLLQQYLPGADVARLLRSARRLGANLGLMAVAFDADSR